MDRGEAALTDIVTVGDQVNLGIGEGGSGGAIAIATANKVLMLEHAIYGVISPEGAASILWRDPTRAQDAAFGTPDRSPVLVVTWTSSCESPDLLEVRSPPGSLARSPWELMR